MSTRTIEELVKEIDLASNSNDVHTLVRCAEELAAIGTTEAQAECANTLGWVAFSTSRYADALDHYHRAIDLFREMADSIGIANVTVRAGMSYTLTGNFADALQYYYEALKIYEELDSRFGIAQTNANIGIVLKNQGDLNGALERYHRTLAVYEEQGELGGIASVSCSIGNVGLITGDFSSALAHYNRALEIYQELGNKRYVAANYLNIGHIYDSTGDYPKALEYYHRALSIDEEINYRNGIASVSTDIGNLYVNIGQATQGLEHLERGLAIFMEIGNRIGIAIATGAIGDVYFDLHDHQKALDYLHRALALNHEIQSMEGIIVNSNAILSVLIAMGSFDEADSMLASLDAMSVNDPRARIHTDRSRASLMEHHGQLDDAMQTLQQALVLAQQQDLAPEQAAIHKQLRDLSEKRTDFAGYIEHNNEFVRITEEINGKDTATKLAMQEAERVMAKERTEHEKHLAVLHSTLPRHIADRVARGEQVTDHFDNAAVIFLDIVGFTTLSDRLTSEQVVQLLSTMFTALDTVCKKHNVVKIKTIGDSYMAVAFPLQSISSEQRAASAPRSTRDDTSSHDLSTEERAASAALDMLNAVSHILSDLPSGLLEDLLSDLPSGLQVRIGLHNGPVTAGVIGTERMQYDVWGDTVNVASRMESSGEAGKIHVSSSFALALNLRPQDLRPQDLRPQGDDCSPFPVPCSLIERGALEIKGKGMMTTYWLSDLQHHS